MSEPLDITPDFSEAVEFDDSQVPPGVYKGRIDSWVSKVSKEKGTPYIQWKFVIFGAEGDLARQNNRPVFLSTMLKGPGTGVLKQLLVAALGEMPVSFEPGWQNALIGRELQFTAKKNIKPDGTEGFPNIGGLKGLS
jgi:hypothetical protein